MRSARRFSGLTAAVTICGISLSSLAQQPAPTQSKPSQAGPGQVDLRPKFKTGQQIKYTFEQTAKSAVKSQDPSDNTLDQEQRQNQRIGLSLRVVQSGDEGATIQVVYESIKMTLTTPDGVAEYDSTKPTTKNAPKPSGTQPATKPVPARQPTKPVAPTPPTPPTPAQPAPPPPSDPLKEIADMDMNGMLGLIVGPMVGTTITVKTDSSGSITSVTGGESLGGSMGGMGGSMMPNPGAMANWLVAGLGGPGNKGFARVGETWTNTDGLSGTPVGAFKMTTRHTLKSASGGLASVSFSGGIEPSTEGTQPGGGGIGQVQSASYAGTYGWDTSSGSLRDMATDMRVTLDGGLMGSKMRMRSETQVKVHRQ
jgi:hypothetical protein